MKADTDIAVVGGGLAGATLALAAASTGISVALVETRPFRMPDAPGARERTTALSAGTRALFERLGLWSALADAAAPIERLHVSQRGSFGRVRVAADEYGLDALGYVVENAALTEALRARIADEPRISLVAPARFEALSVSDDAVQIDLTCGHEDSDGAGVAETLSARLVVGADGSRSRVREALAIGATTRDYGQRALITTLEPERSHEHCAYERFTPDGPMALLPRDSHRCALVWTLPSARAQTLEAAGDAEFAAALNAAFGARLGHLTPAGGRGSYPLARVLCDTPVARRGVVIGNAGHALHPAAAQGFNLAVRDGLALVATLTEARAWHGQAADPGEAGALAAWAETRRPDQRRVAGFTDLIVRVFSNHLPGLSAARAAGLCALSLAPGVRHDIARRSLGLALAPDFIPATALGGDRGDA